MFRKVLAGATAVLVLFHVWLLAGQLWNGQLAEVGLLVRWLAAGGLAAALLELRRQGGSMFVGRKAVAVWLLAALLHAPAIGDRVDVSGAPDLPEVVATLTLASGAATFGLGLFLLLAFGALRRLTPAVPRAVRSTTRALVGAISSDARFRFAPRPPPVA
jgi:hypothetical protein